MQIYNALKACTGSFALESNRTFRYNAQDHRVSGIHNDRAEGQTVDAKE